MSEGCFKGWKWCEFQPDQIQSLGYYLVDDKLKPPGEPHPDQLKRCEVCWYYTIDRGVETCTIDDPEFTEIPNARTCSRWTWDEHDTGDN